ncbi:NAD(P)H-flavin reductase [Limnohabitans sp. TS-CS-82]|uniref:FAD-binding oxidoreductase n=1 Tax=Limnohabitans sp. TS-CS-82 TaxID=2094193 RepID=UPI000CF1D3E3|nr:FAD-binding oxidoreductase [Limnohabitans sp. TS-CS-82]PQA81821.1 NAD(P)H-flavin reductase [Limnohabitans sp. TS-CS-82]
MPVVNLSNGREFSATAGDSLVEAALFAGITLPHSCKTGRCSTCKCKVSRGETTALQTETGLTDAEKAEGWILSCVRSAQTDVTLEVEDLGDVVLPQSKTLPCRISNIDQLTSDVVRVTLRLPPSADFRSIPGQYIDVIGPGGVRRSYSLANANTADKNLELHIRAVDGGMMSDYWFKQAKANDLLRFNGPLGTFFLRNLANLNLVFLATGTGIAPVKAMLESLTNNDTEYAPQSVTVFWGGRTAEDLYFDPQTIQAGHRFVPVLSRAAAGWAGVTGYVHNALLATQPDLAHTVVYACGSDAMIRSAKASLLAAGLPEALFFADAFVPSAPQ